MSVTMFGLASCALVLWAGLVLFWGKFWWADQKLGPLPDQDSGQKWPSVAAVIPARDEAATIAHTVTSLLQQDYPGRLDVVVVDDNSSDGTADVAAQAADTINGGDRFHLVQGKPLETGWSGKLWAVDQGITVAEAVAPDATYLLLTDADIAHHSENLRKLISKADLENRDLVSLMVRLNCTTPWEHLLIPAFVFFFQKLYPFPWVNDPTRRMAAAAGGCMLVRRRSLEAAGGIKIIRDRLIDDCALAALMKQHGSIWLGLSRQTVSLRRYDYLGEIWRMVARTAFEQLDHSVLNLTGAVVGMLLLYVTPPAAVLLAVWQGDAGLLAVGAGGWSLMALAYLPTLKLYDRPPLFGISLPVAGVLYTLMTLDSARRHWAGAGGGWKGRTYETGVPTDGK